MRHFTVADGLPSPEVHCIFQDSRGKIWFGTDMGACCYDGTAFTYYTTRDGLADHTIFGIFEDSRGWIWFRGYNGLPCWFDGQQIVQPPVNTLLRQKLAGRAVLTEMLDTHDTLWLGLFGSCSWLKIPPGFTRVIEQRVGDENQVLIKEVKPGGLMMTAGAIGNSLSAELPGKRLRLDTPIQDNSWRSTFAGIGPGEYLVHFMRTSLLIAGDSIRVREEASPVTFIYPEANGDYWLCGQKPGGARLMRRGARGETMLLQYLPDYDVTSCLRDHEGGLWFGTQESGVFYIPFPEMREVYGLPMQTGDRITALTGCPGGGALAGSLRGELFRVQNDQCEKWEIPGMNPPGTINSMSTIGNQVLIGAVQSVLYDFTTRTGKALYDPNSPARPLLLKCAMPFHGDCWLGVSIKSLYCISRSGEVTVLLPALPERITGLARTRGDTLWLGGLSRLWMFVPGKEPVDWSNRHPELEMRADELAGDTAGGQLWLLSRSKGIFSISGDSICDLQEKQPGLPPICFRLLFDGRLLWIGAGNGLYGLDSLLQLQAFQAAGGLPLKEVELLCHAPDGTWLCGDGRLFHFRAEDFPFNTVPPRICFRSVFCNGRALPYDDGEASFRYDENTFRFRFAGQSYKSPGRTRFLVRLFGIDHDWRETEEPDITYYSLPPGRYSFVAYALNNSGVSSVSPVRYSFAVLPPFWQRTWFQLLALLVVGGVTMLLTRNYLQRFRREETARRRLAELEITALRAQMNPHFIFNAINSIYHFVLTGDREASASYVVRFARLIRNVLEMTSRRQVPLDQELETLRLYMDIEQLRFREAFRYRIDVDPALDPATVKVAPMLIQPYVENAIWHGLLHKETKGSLTITLRKENGSLTCTVDDDGVGRARAELAKKADPELSKHSLGSVLNRRRLELLHELYGADFSVQYVDKDELPGSTETGTRVILHIPAIPPGEK